MSHTCNWGIKWLYRKDDTHGRVLEKEGPMMLWWHQDCLSVENVENPKSRIDCVAAAVSIKEGPCLVLTPI